MPKGASRQGRRRERRPADPAGSPLGFWRRGHTRPHRGQARSRGKSIGWWQRLTGLYFPPWVPVVIIIIVVFGILGLLFFTREATGAPRAGDHWHATYQIDVCGQRQPNIPAFPGGVHTHGDGLIHIHPGVPSEEGSGARLVKFFEYGGGKLTQGEMRIPGQRQTYKNGDQCEDGSTGVLQVFVNGQKMGDWSRYIPRDGDQIRIVFGPEETPPSELQGIVIAPEQATRQINVEAGDRGNADFDSFFNPNALGIRVGETVKINIRNTGTQSHNLRLQGVDRQYGTEDDFVSRPVIIVPGKEGFTVVRIDQPGEYAFRCDIHPNVQFGTLNVTGAQPTPTPAGGTPAATPTPAAP